MECTYIIKTLADVTQDHWDACIDTAEICVKSLDETLVTLRWCGDTPAIFVGETEYTHGELIDVYNAGGWRNNTI